MKNNIRYICAAVALLCGCTETIPEQQEIPFTETVSVTEKVTDTTAQTSEPPETESTFNVIELGTSAETEETIPEWVTADTVTEQETESRVQDDYDIDLTQLGSTMLYAQVCNMIYEPTEFIGKSVKIKAPFTVAEEDGNIYYALMIYDSTACCVQGIEFDLGEGYAYPEDYPEIGEEITIGGIFGSYQEGIATYYKLYGAVRLD